MNSQSSESHGGETVARKMSKTILVVLSDEQRDDYKADFDPLARAGIDFVYESSGDDALDRVTECDPGLVIVGMTNDTMDGLEFVAQLMRRYPSFDRKVVVLPEKDDPFPPVIQWHDAVTGRSATEESDFAGVLALARSLLSASGTAAAPRAPASAKPVPAAAPSLKKTRIGLGAFPKLPEPNPAPIPAPVSAAIASPDVQPSAAATFSAGTSSVTTEPTALPPLPPIPKMAIDDTAHAFGPPAAAQPNAPAAPKPAASLGLPATSSASATSSALTAMQAGVAVPPDGPALLGVPGSLGAKVGQPQLVLPRSKKKLTIAVIASVVALAILLFAIFISRSNAPARAADPDTHSKPPGHSAVDSVKHAPGESSPAASGVEQVSARAVPAPVASAPGPSADLPNLQEMATLPLVFERASEAYTVSDPALLERMVRSVHEALQKNATSHVEVGGHASQEGNRRFNWQIAGRRAAAVREYLEQHDVDKRRMVIKSYGTTRPLQGEEKDEDRRVTLRLIP